MQRHCKGNRQTRGWKRRRCEVEVIIINPWQWSKAVAAINRLLKREGLRLRYRRVTAAGNFAVWLERAEERAAGEEAQ